MVDRGHLEIKSRRIEELETKNERLCSAIRKVLNFTPTNAADLRLQETLRNALEANA